MNQKMDTITSQKGISISSIRAWGTATGTGPPPIGQRSAQGIGPASPAADERGRVSRPWASARALQLAAVHHDGVDHDDVEGDDDGGPHRVRGDEDEVQDRDAGATRS
ncbi:hypothetical protein [Pseudonocardia adelaidensis]|uniref:hypothetical protein n=1 Tax=Pseudonocardia adelaidensis TaxID=648754 RepID=UPI0031F1C1C8